MRCEHDYLALFKNSWDQLFGIIYPIICIICACELVRRIRYRQRTGNILPLRQMDAPSGKSGGEQASGATNADSSCPMQTTQDLAPLSSACDILQPLSHSLPLPPSGYLAAVLGEKQRREMSQTSQLQHERMQSARSSCCSSDDSGPGSLQSGCKPASGIERSPTQSNDSSEGASPRTRRTAEVDDREHPSYPDSGETRSVQKRSQEVQFLREVDEDGVRTFRRWLVEYS